MTNETDDLERDIPWLVNNTLDPADRERLLAQLAQHPELAEDREFLDAVRRGIRQERIASPGEFGLHRLNRTLDAMAAEDHKSVATQPSSGGRDWWRFSLAAAVMVIAIQGGVLWSVVRDADTDYRLLGSGTSSGTILQVEFQPDAREADIRALLSGIGGQLIDGPSALDLYRVRIDGDRQHAEEKLGQLKGSTTVVRYAEIE